MKVVVIIMITTVVVVVITFRIVINRGPSLHSLI